MTLNDFVQEGVQKIQTNLTKYSADRVATTNQYVGQFIDDEGIKDSQYGTYGMSSFLVMTKGMHDVRVTTIKNQCIDKLKTWINASANYDLSQRPNDANDKTESDKSNTYELRNILPKMCFAYIACKATSELSVQELIIAKFIAESQNDDGSFGFLSTDKGKLNKTSLVNTALVLRTYLKDSSNESLKTNCITYLKNNIATLSNIFEQLYVLNSIQLTLLEDASLRKNGFKKFHQTIQKTLKLVFHEVALNPTSFANPINIDFNDLNRTRYYRLQSDLILLESLALAYPTNLAYLRGHLGERIIKKIGNCVENNTPKDTTYHRMSFGFYFNLFQIITILETKFDEKIGLWGKFQARAVRSRMFGIDFSKEAYIILYSSPFVLALIGINLILSNLKPPIVVPPYVNTIVAFLLARLANIFGIYYDKKKKNKI